MLFKSIKHILSHTRDIRMVKTPHTIRYDIPLYEKVGELIQIKDIHGGMVLIFKNPDSPSRKTSKEFPILYK